MTNVLTRGRATLAGALLLSTLVASAMPASATVAPGGTSANVELVAAPPSLAAGQLTSDTKIRVINEQQLSVSGTITVLAISTNGWAGTKTLTAGVCVQSHMIHMNRVSGTGTIAGTVDFTQDIVGVATDVSGLLSGALTATDPIFGNPGTTNPAAAGRGLELLPLDIVTFPNSKRVNLSLRTGTGDAIDELRVITLCDPPTPVVPEAPFAVLLPLSGLVVGALIIAKRRRSFARI